MTWTAPRTWVTGETVTADQLNTHVRDNLKAIGDAWTSYTPTLIGVTLGNGTITGRYMQAGKLVRGYVKLTIGSTTSVTSGIDISLPVTSARGAFCPLGTGACKDTGVSNPYLVNAYASTTTRLALGAGGGTSVGVNATNPFAWATGDTLEVEFAYEAA